jgi:DNA-binding FrmR family transcriptional regulator
MRNKKLAQNRLRTLQGQLKKLDMNIHRGGTRETINASQKEISETIQDIVDIIERED